MIEYNLKLMKILSNLLIIIGVLILVLTFGRPLKQEINYRLSKISGTTYRVLEPGETEDETDIFVNNREKIITPVDTEFGIVIPKIGANAEVFSNIDPFNPKEFLPILKQGVAHAKGTGFPGEGKNIYLFAHSTDAFFNFDQYNAVFYLIGKLNEDDEIDIFYQGELYKYKVFEKMVVSPDAVEYLKPEEEEILTLQTCYPPGTTIKRLVVRARLANIN